MERLSRWELQVESGRSKARRRVSEYVMAVRLNYLGADCREYLELARTICPFIVDLSGSEKIDNEERAKSQGAR